MLHRIYIYLVLFFSSLLWAQRASIIGHVDDGRSGRSLIDINIVLEGVDGFRLVATTSESGAFAFAELPGGMYTLTATHVGYRTQVLEDIALAADERRSLAITLVPRVLELDEVVVQSASLGREKAIEAPAAISVLDRGDILARPALTPVEHLKRLPGVDFNRLGLDQHRAVVRGFNEILSDRLLVLSDHRVARIPALRTNIYQLIPSGDLERIEVISGPAAALYGPNSAGGVMHLLSASPFDTPGTIVSLDAGERSLVAVALRHAGLLGADIAYRISGRHYRGTDWKGSDPLEPIRVIRGVYTATGRVSEDRPVSNRRDFSVRNTTLDGRLDFRPGENLNAVLASGVRRSSNIEYSGLGALQVEDASYRYAQGRIFFKEFFAQAFLNQYDTGRTHLLRSGDRLIDKSRLFGFGVRHGAKMWRGHQRFIYGSDLFLTRPDTDHTTNGRNEDDDNIDEVGLYLQSVTGLTPALQLAAALRWDDHSRLPDPVLSPRLALVYQVRAGHALRATYNRAFTTPSSDAFSSDVTLLADLIFLPYALRLQGVPDEGWTFRRDGGGGLSGLYMQSPYLPDPAAYIAAEATGMWDTVVGLLAAEGVDLSVLPPPQAEQVATSLGAFNDATFSFDPVAPQTVVDIKPLKAIINNVFEVGYKGAVNDNLYLTADLHFTRIEDGRVNFMATPNVFFDVASLTTYLEDFMGAAEAAALAEQIGTIPLGTVTPVAMGERNPAALTFTDRNIDRDLSLFGADFSLNYYWGLRWRLGAAYSHLHEDFFVKEDFYVNAPKHKGHIGVQYFHPGAAWDVQMDVRYVHNFPYFGGVYAGRVEKHAVVDLNVHYTLPFAAPPDLTLSVQNLLDDPYRDIVGSPAIGRLALVRLTQSF